MGRGSWEGGTGGERTSLDFVSTRMESFSATKPVPLPQECREAKLEVRCQYWSIGAWSSGEKEDLGEKQKPTQDQHGPGERLARGALTI